MIDQAAPQVSAQDIEALLREELSRGDAMADTVLCKEDRRRVKGIE